MSKKHHKTSTTQEIEPKLLIISFQDIVHFYQRNLLLLLLLTVVCIIAYAPILNGQFLSADDLTSIVSNQKLRNFGQTIGSLHWSTVYSSALINIFGVRSAPFHVGILGLHIINTFLVLLLTYILFGTRSALYAALIFSVLPSGSEAVFWISGMGYVFQTFFALISINLYFIYRNSGRLRYLALSSTVYFLSFVFTQTPWMLIVPLIIVPLDLFVYTHLHSKSRVKSIRLFIKQKSDYFAYLAVSILYYFIWMGGQYSLRATALVKDYYSPTQERAPFLQRLPYTTFKTIELYVFPWKLSFFHEEVLTKALYYFMVVISVCTVVLVIYLISKKSVLAGLILAIFASIAPTFSPVQVAWFVAERYLYLGAAFFAMILSLIIIWIDRKYQIRNLATCIFISLLVLYSVRLFVRAGDFKSSKALWLATQKTAPASYRVYNNLGDVYSLEQNWPMAIASFQYATKLAPNYYDAIHNLGYTYMLIGDLENAKKYLLESYQINPKLYQALEKLGQIELYQGNKEKAKEYFDKALEINPDLKGLPQL